MKANIHYYLGMLYKNNSKLVNEMKVDIHHYLDVEKSEWLNNNNNVIKLFSLLAIREYIEALKIELKEYFETEKTEKDYSFIYGSHKATFSGICDKIGSLLLKLGKSYDKENQPKYAITLIQEALKYFKISVNPGYIKECSNILTAVLAKQPKNIKHDLQKDLYNSLGEFLLKSGFPPKAASKFYQALSFIKSEEKENLLIKILETEKSATNTAFLENMVKKGKIEDFTIFQNKNLGKILLNITKIMVKEIIDTPKEQQYKDPYEIDLPQPPEMPQLPLPQSQALPLPPQPAPVKMPLKRQQTDKDIQKLALNDDEYDKFNEEKQNVGLVQNLNSQEQLSDLQFNLLHDNNVILQGASHNSDSD